MIPRYNLRDNLRDTLRDNTRNVFTKGSMRMWDLVQQPDNYESVVDIIYSVNDANITIHIFT